jgi:adenosine/AMP kinase
MFKFFLVITLAFGEKLQISHHAFLPQIGHFLKTINDLNYTMGTLEPQFKHTL